MEFPDWAQVLKSIIITLVTTAIKRITNYQIACVCPRPLIMKSIKRAQDQDYFLDDQTFHTAHCIFLGTVCRMVETPGQCVRGIQGNSGVTI